MASNDWSQYFGGPQRILVNARHVEVHYSGLAADLLPLLAVPPGGSVLDFGCGEAGATPTLADSGLNLLLFDGAEAIRRRLADRFARRPNVTVLDPERCRELPADSLDHVLVVSVSQYLSRAEMNDLVARWKAQIKSGGDILICDVVRPDLGMWPDLRALLCTAARHGFLLAAVAGIVRTFFSDYRRLRRTAGFTHYTEAEMRSLLESHGLAVERIPNPGINPARLAFRARKAG